MNSMQDKQFSEDYVLVGTDLTGLWIQPGFVEGVVEDQKSFSSLHKAYRHIFSGNLEYAIFLWNGIPVRIDYRSDLPCMVSSIIAMLDCVSQASEYSDIECNFKTENFETRWRVSVEEGIVNIVSQWKHITGGYEAILNQMGVISMDRQTFMSEWKLLLQQFLQAMDDSGARLRNDVAINEMKTLDRLCDGIQVPGRFYQYQ